MQKAKHLLALTTGMALLAPALASGQEYDVLIRGGTVYDGSDSPAHAADVAIKGDRIVQVGNIPTGAKAALTIDAKGKIVSPGFIDPHSHSAQGLETAELAAALPQLYQGVTTVMTNPDGGGPSDLTEQLTKTRGFVPGVNVAPMIGHNAVRKAVLGDADAQPTPQQQQAMEMLVKKAMDEGAFGFSSGLEYIPGKFSHTPEIIGMAKVAARYPHAFYTSHMREEGVDVLKSVAELVEISREAKITAVATHYKALGKIAWGSSKAMIAAIDKARSEGLPVWADQYPYEANSSSAQGMFVPGWAQAGGSAELVKRLGDPALRARIRTETAQKIIDYGGPDRVKISRYDADPSLKGMMLDQIAKAKGVEWIDALLSILENGGAGVVIFSLNPDDVEAIMKQQWTMTGSDGSLVAFGSDAGHPRAYGTFPRKIRNYVLDKPVISMQQAIHAATGLPAQVFGFTDRGLLKSGYIADVIVFDPTTIRDRATFDNSHAYSEGMVYVFVNGEAAVADGKATAERHGRVLTRYK